MEFCYFGSLEKVIVPLRSKYINLLDVNGEFATKNSLKFDEESPNSIEIEDSKTEMYSMAEDIITGLTKGNNK